MRLLRLGLLIALVGAACDREPPAGSPDQVEQVELDEPCPAGSREPISGFTCDLDNRECFCDPDRGNRVVYVRELGPAISGPDSPFEPIRRWGSFRFEYDDTGVLRSAVGGEDNRGSRVEWTYDEQGRWALLTITHTRPRRLRLEYRFEYGEDGRLARIVDLESGYVDPIGANSDYHHVVYPTDASP